LIRWFLAKLFPPRLPRFAEGEFNSWRRELPKTDAESFHKRYHGVNQASDQLYKPIS